MPTLTTVRKIERVSIDALQESDWNPNLESRESLDALKASIRQNGLVDPLIVRKTDNSIIGGHHRLYAVRELVAEGWKLPGGMVPVVYLNVSEEEAKRLSLALNKIRGEPDLDKLGELLRELREVSDTDELAATGYSAQEIDDLVRSISDAGEDDSDGGMTELAFRVTPREARSWTGSVLRRGSSAAMQMARRWSGWQSGQAGCGRSGLRSEAVQVPEYPDYRTEYIQSPQPISTRRLAKKWGVPYNTICTQCTKEGWVAERRQFQGKIKAESEREAVETLAEARTRWAKEYRTLQAAGLKALKRLQPRTAGEAARLVDVGIRGEALQRENETANNLPEALAELLQTVVIDRDSA
jgi:hypothetical protein